MVGIQVHVVDPITHIPMCGTERPMAYIGPEVVPDVPPDRVCARCIERLWSRARLAKLRRMQSDQD